MPFSTLRNARFGPCRWPLAVLLFTAGGAAHAQPQATPPGAEETAKTKLLVGGATLLQRQAPLRPMEIYLVGFHAAKNDPSQQIEAHHYCAQVNQDFMQCTLFDGNTAEANLIGIEYIISEALFEQLPEDEKPYWHPHNYEILSGALIAPGLPSVAEHALMRGKMNSYGKTWHVWSTVLHGQAGDRMPLGAPTLEWSFNRDGEAQPGLVESRDQRMDLSTPKTRQNRADLVPLAHPQAGVDALKDRFNRPTEPVPGVVDKRAAPEPPQGK